MGFFPDINCFAIPANSISTIFFFRSLQLGTTGIDIIAQFPFLGTSLFLCLPVDMVVWALGKFLAFSKSIAVLLFPPLVGCCFLAHPVSWRLAASRRCEDALLDPHFLLSSVCSLSVHFWH
jgi:hypothetical protein